MARVLRRVLSCVLALLVALSPIQGAVAYAGAGSSHGEKTHRLAPHVQSAPAMHDATEMAEACDRCVDSACERQYFCGSAQCGSCGLAILVPFSPPVITADSIQSVETPQPVRRLPAGLFRPPRA